MAAWEGLSEGVKAARAGPEVLLVRGDEVLAIGAGPIFAQKQGAHRLLAGLAGGEGVEAMAVAGILWRRRGRWPAWRYAVCFVEWPDGRWWLGQRRVDEGGAFLPDADVDVYRAVDGCGLPGGLGRWFARARFEGLRADLRLREPEVVN